MLSKNVCDARPRAHTKKTERTFFLFGVFFLLASLATLARFCQSYAHRCIGSFRFGSLGLCQMPSSLRVNVYVDVYRIDTILTMWLLSIQLSRSFSNRRLSFSFSLFHRELRNITRDVIVYSTLRSIYIYIRTLCVVCDCHTEQRRRQQSAHDIV